MRNKKKIIFIGIGIIVVILLILPFIKSSAEVKPEFVTSEAQISTILNEVTATGTINPQQKIDVGTQVSGIITKLYVDFNDVVKKGQIIARIDTTNLRIAIVDAQANLIRARAQFTQQKTEFERYKELLEKKAIAQSDYDLIKANYLVAESNIKSAEANLKRAETNFAYATITAPIDGIIINRNVEEGQTVAANFQAPILFTIANDLKKMELQARVDEADIGQVKTGQQVKFTVDAYPNEEFKGVVRQIRLQPTTNQNVVTYTVIIDSANPDLKLLPGMNANISIIILEKKDVLTVPLSAFSVRNESDSALKNDFSRIYTLSEKDSLIPIQVVKGIDDGNSAEIISGNVKKGTKIITGVKDVENKQIKSFLPTPKKHPQNQMMRP